MASRLCNQLVRNAFNAQSRKALGIQVAAMNQFMAQRQAKINPSTQIVFARNISYQLPKDMSSVQKVCSKLTTFQKFNLSAIVMGVGIPVAWVLAPSVLVFPIDLAIGIALPYHMAHGVGDVAMDYAPMHLREMAKKLIYLISILAALGFLKINLCGPGITMSVKSLWKKPAKKDAAAAAPAKA